jgi:segregation and condensation protein B
VESLFVTMTLKQVIEALVFASPKPLLTKEIVAALRAAGQGTEDQNALDLAKSKEDDVLAALVELQADLAAQGRAFQVVERVNGWTMVSDSSCAQWVRQLYPEAKPTRLTGPQLETLAIIAYRQPVTRADIEAVRGVAVDGVMQILLDRGLVKIAGRAEVPGRPLLYSTTEYFLEHFGLKTTDDLPNASELKRVVLPTAAPAEGAAPAAETPAGETPADAPAWEIPAGEIPASEIPGELPLPAETSVEPEPESESEPEPELEPEAPAEEHSPEAPEEPVPDNERPAEPPEHE